MVHDVPAEQSGAGFADTAEAVIGGEKVMSNESVSIARPKRLMFVF
jgi:hypothetical protein